MWMDWLAFWIAGFLLCLGNILIFRWGPPIRPSFWDGVIEKIKRHLTSWKMMYLSKDGRFTLIKSTLSNLPTYFLSIFPLPTGVANRIEKLHHNFLCGEIGDEFKFHLVSWSKVCTSISEGGGYGT